MSEHNGSKYAPRPGSIPGVPCNLGGHDFVLAPLALLALREVEAEGARLREAQATPEQMYGFMSDVVYRSLIRNYPDMTRDELDALVDAGNIVEANDKVLNSSGMKRVKPGEIQGAAP